MKKIFAITLAAVIAAFAFFSCEKSDSSSTGNAIYSVGIAKMSGDISVFSEISAIYKEEIAKALPGASVDGSRFTVNNVVFKDSDAKVVNACKTAESRVNSAVTIPAGSSYTIEITSSHIGGDFSGSIYSHTFSK